MSPAGGRQRSAGLRPILVATVLLLAAAPVQAKKCAIELSVDNWLRSFDTDPHLQQPMLDRLASCLPQDPAARELVDYLATRSLDAADVLEEDARVSFVEYNVEVLHLNALAGHPSSQHNYAVVHNAEPGTLIYQIVPQDQKVFVYWTRKAASQGEPRAVFNLAARMGRDNPPQGIDYNPALAYTLLALLKDTYEHDPSFPKDMMEFIVAEVMRLADVIDTGQRDDAARALKKFDFAMLAPTAQE